MKFLLLQVPPAPSPEHQWAPRQPQLLHFLGKAGGHFQVGEQLVPSPLHCTFGAMWLERQSAVPFSPCPTSSPAGAGPSYGLSMFSWVPCPAFNVITTLKSSGSTFFGVEKFKWYHCSYYNIGALDSDLTCGRGLPCMCEKGWRKHLLVPYVVGRLKRSWNKLKLQR